MVDVVYTELIITCEACHTVKKFKAETYEECMDIFREYQCPNGCARNLYSFIAIGKLQEIT